MTDVALAPEPKTEVIVRGGFWRTLRYWLSNWKLSLGLALVLSLILFSLIGSFFVERKKADMMWGPLRARPSIAEGVPLGTDNTGRDMLALMVYGIPTSLAIGLMAGGIGTVVGTILGLMTGFYRGRVDNIIRTIADIFLTVPSLMILVVIASYVRSTTIQVTAVVIALFAWPGPTRSIRAQTLSMRERGFVSLARLSGLTDFEIIIRHILPNLLPYIMAGFVGSISGAILASVGIQLLGLGPLHIPNLGMILQFAFYGAAIYQGMWWWWGPPTFALLILFLGMFLISMGLDEYANPRLRQRAS
jgi:peptide/nickel transport system permease protein